MLLIFALQERRARIETGYGLEADITDLVARRILDEVVLPKFEANEHLQGLLAGLSALGYVKTRNEAFLDPSYDLPLTGPDLVSQKTGGIGELDVDRGLRYLFIWCGLLWLLPIVFRLFAILKTTSAGEPRPVRYLLHLDGAAWAVKFFLTINPGILIFLSPLFIDPVKGALASALASEEGQAALRHWHAWLLILVLVPIVLRRVSYAIGLFRPNKNPVFMKPFVETILLLLALEGTGTAVLVGKAFLAIVPGVFVALMPLFMKTEGEKLLAFLACAATLAIYGTVQWRFVMAPMISERAYRRAEARLRLGRIKRRVIGTSTQMTSAASAATTANFGTMLTLSKRRPSHDATTHPDLQPSTPMNMNAPTSRAAAPLPVGHEFSDRAGAARRSRCRRATAARVALRSPTHSDRSSAHHARRGRRRHRVQHSELHLQLDRQWPGLLHRNVLRRLRKSSMQRAAHRRHALGPIRGDVSPGPRPDECGAGDRGCSHRRRARPHCDHQPAC